jgi:hypothetical protein
MELISTIEFTPIVGSIETTVFILIIGIISAVYNAMKKKNDSSDDWSSNDTLPPQIPRPHSRTSVPPPVAAKTVDWEEELKRLLAGESGPAKYPPRPAPPAPLPRKPAYIPPPPIRQPKSEPTMALPQVFREEKFYKGHCTECGGSLEFRPRDMEETISCPHCHQMTVLRPFEQTRVETLSRRKEVGDFGQGAKTWQRASGIDQRTTTEMADKLSRPVATTELRSQKRSAETESVVTLLRSPQTARQVVIAGLILSPPKAMEG